MNTLRKGVNYFHTSIRLERAHLDFGRSRLNFATVSNNAFLGLANLIMLRKSISRVRKKEWTNLRAAIIERSWYIKAVIARGIDERASVCSTAGRVGVAGYK